MTHCGQGLSSCECCGERGDLLINQKSEVRQDPREKRHEDQHAECEGTYGAIPINVQHSSIGLNTVGAPLHFVLAALSCDANEEYEKGVTDKFMVMLHAAALSGADCVIIPDVGA
eukprot:6187451-Amphidinium_carterae.2